MGLLTKTVDVRVNGSTYKHFEDLGYEIPKHYNQKKKKWLISTNEYITVDVFDLYKGSAILVKCECDNCKKIYDVPYWVYLTHDLSNGFLCKGCYHKLLLSGENHPNWNPSLTDEDRIVGRNYPEYKEFIKKVLVRDNYTCYRCGIESHNNAEVHHLDGYDWCVDKRTDETNGVCLCEKCHSNFHAHYGMGNNTKEQFEDWIGRPIENFNKYDGVLSSAKEVVCLEDRKTYASCLDASRYYHIDPHQINFCCNKIEKYLSVGKLHFMWLQDYSVASEDEIQTCLNRKPKNWKSVICITTNKVFDNASNAATFYNMKRGNDKILKVCKGERQSAGKDPITNEKLVWRFYDIINQKVIEV